MWHKVKSVVKIRGGKGQANTVALTGFIQHIIVLPESKDTLWSMKIIDKDGDEIYDIHDCYGRLDDKHGLPIGRDTPERLAIKFYEVTANENILVILKVRELV